MKDEISRGAADIATERRRQIEAEGFSADHDDVHVRHELAVAAACYTVCGVAPEWRRNQIVGEGDPPPQWPWSLAWWKPRDRRSDLVRAGALIAAEIDRLDRQEGKT